VLVESSRGVTGRGVRPCAKEELEAVERIVRACPEAAQWSAAAIQQAWSCHPDLFLVAWQANQITGFICGRMAADEGEILNMAVQQEVRRDGHGRRLTLGLLERFRRAKLARVFLEVRESNTVAMAFYSQLGFEPIGRRVDYYQTPKEAAVVLGLRL